MIKTIFLLSMVLLSFTVFSSADAQTPQIPYIELDKPEYFYGDVIQATGYFEVVPLGYPDGYVMIDGTISGDVVLGNTRTPIDMQSNTMSFSFDTVNLVPFEHASLPHDGIYTMQMRYVFDDPVIGLMNKYVTLDFEYNTYNYNPTERMVALEGDVAGLQQDVSQFNEHITQLNGDVATNQQDIAGINTSLTTINGTLSTAQQDIINLQNAPALPPDLLARIDALETEVAKIATIETNQNTFSTSLTNLVERVSNIELEVSSLDTTQTNQNGRITILETDLTTLQSQQVPTNAELQTSIMNHTGRITTLENIPSVDLTPIEIRITELENNPTDLTPLENDIATLQTLDTTIQTDITNLQTDVSQIQTEITAIVLENATPQDVEQNLRMDGIESNITNLFTANQTQSGQIDENNRIIFLQMDADNRHAIDISNLQTDVTELQSDVQTYSVAVDINRQSNLITNQRLGNIDIDYNVRTQLDELHGNVTSIKQTDATLQNNIDTLEGTVTRNHHFAQAIGSGVVTNQDDIKTINQKITRFDTDLTELERVVGVNHQKTSTDIAGMKTLLGTHNNSIEAFDLEHREFQSRIDGFNAHLLSVDGQIQALIIDVDNIQSTSPHDDTQNLRLADIESDIRFIEREIDDALFPAIQAFGLRMAGAEQSIDSFIREHLDIWNELDHKQNVLDAP